MSTLLAENLVKMSKVTVGEDSRVRGLSNVSKDSMGSDTEELLFKRGEVMRQEHPYRQPLSPPEASLAQVDAGFRRFLKEHSSPPNTRVTAGGRIVPVGSHMSSPPTFNPASIDDVLHGQTQAETINTPAVSNTTHSIGDQARRSSPTVIENYPQAPPAQGSQATSQNSEASLVTVLPPTNLEGQEQSFPTPLPPGAKVLMQLAHGPTLVAINDTLFEATPHGFNTILAPLRPMQSTLPLTNVPVYPALQTMAPVSMPPAAPLVRAQPWPPLSMINNAPSPSHQPTPEVQRQTLQEQYDDHRAQLEQLDKYVALHRSELGSFALASIVAQRRQLVIKLDDIRVKKDNGLHVNTTVPYRTVSEVLPVLPSFGNGNAMGHFQSQYIASAGLPTMIGVQRMHGAGFPGHPNDNLNSISTQVPVSHGMQTKAWPPMPIIQEDEARAWQQNLAHVANNPAMNVDSTPTSHHNFAGAPSDSWKYRDDTSSPGSPEEHAWPQQSLGFLQASAFGTGDPPSTSFNPALGPSWKHFPAQQPSNAVLQEYSVGHNGFSSNQSTFGLAYQQDARTPIVTDQQACYATRLALNPPNGPKKYCTTPAEFAEVIRQAREQAKLYGRADTTRGDPQYEAEQDIRWAMAEHEPVPLPQRVPEYFTNPEPWSWPPKSLENELGGFPHAGEDYGMKWRVSTVDAQEYGNNRKAPSNYLGYPQAANILGTFENSGIGLAAQSQSNQTYGEEATTPFAGAINSTGSQTNWTENNNGELTRQSKQAIVEEMPPTPSHRGIGVRSATVGAIPMQTNTPLPNAWEVPSSDNLKGQGKAKDSSTIVALDQ